MNFLSRPEAGCHLRCEVRNRPRKIVLLLVLVCSALVYWLPLATAQTPNTNQLPNPQFRGSNGLVSEFNGTVNGEIPTLWRSFAVDGADVTTEVVPLAADTLFPGSPPTNAVRLTINSFGAGQGFDTSPVRFSLVPGQTYSAKVYLRSDNADLSDQQVSVGVPVFDDAGNFTGRAPGTLLATATGDWTLFTGPDFSELPNTTAELSFRPINDGGDNSLLIALPEVAGPPISNLVPNPNFAGTGGVIVDSATGPVPDFWRGFGVSGGGISLDIVPVNADELYPGSPATNAVQLTVNSFLGDTGFDHEQTPFPIIPVGRSLWGEVYLRSANSDNSPQVVGVSIPLFDNSGFIGNPGIFVATATVDWGYWGGFSFTDAQATLADMAFRLVESGSENSILIALPTVNGIPNLILADGFEALP